MCSCTTFIPSLIVWEPKKGVFLSVVPVHNKQCVPCIQQGTSGSEAITTGGGEAASGPYFHTPLAKQTAANSLGRREAELQETQLRCFRDLFHTNCNHGGL